MAKNLPHIEQIKLLSNSYGASVIAGLLGITERAMQKWETEPDRTPRKETLLKIGELFARHKQGENLATANDLDDFRGKYIKSLEEQVATLKTQVSLLTAEMRHIALTSQAISQTNQDLLIEMIAKQRKADPDEVAFEVGKVVVVNYERAKQMDIVPVSGR